MSTVDFRESNSHVKDQYETRLNDSPHYLQGLMAVHIMYKSDEDMTKKVAIITTTFSESMGHSMAGDYNANSLN